MQWAEPAGKLLVFESRRGAGSATDRPHVIPPVATRKRKLVLASLAVLALAYLAGPVVAAIFEIGNRAGPKLYPESLHETIYMLTWELTPHEENKPRLPAVFRSEYRPWFYGMYSKNDDPAWLEAEYKKLHERLAAERRAG